MTILTQRAIEIKTIAIGDLVKFNKPVKLLDDRMNAYQIKEGTIGIIASKNYSGLKENYEDEIELLINNVLCRGINIWDPDIEIIKKEKTIETSKQ